MSDTLVDTSGWVAFLRGEEAAVRRIGPLLADGRAAVTGPIAAEVLSGARSRRDFDILKSLLDGLDQLEEPASLWERVAELRFALARSGYQASLIDLTIALSSLDAGHTLLTRDADFRRIQAVVPMELEVF
ncbi:MAG: type II toxin-antitoxin system VapC family toxin [Thermoanaerobaculia bacterium]